MSYWKAYVSERAYFLVRTRPETSSVYRTWWHASSGSLTAVGDTEFEALARRALTFALAGKFIARWELA